MGVTVPMKPGIDTEVNCIGTLTTMEFIPVNHPTYECVHWLLEPSKLTIYGHNLLEGEPALPNTVGNSLDFDGWRVITQVAAVVFPDSVL